MQAYDPAWAQAFEREAELLRGLAGPEFIAAHHIGSTAIPTIVAKPIVDVLLEVHSIARFDLLAESMRRQGYQAMGEYGLPGRRYFRKYTHAGQQLALAHSNDMAAYVDGKAPFIRDVEAKALAWSRTA